MLEFHVYSWEDALFIFIDCGCLPYSLEELEDDDIEFWNWRQKEIKESFIESGVAICNVMDSSRIVAVYKMPN